MVIKIDSGGQITSVPSSVPMGTILKEVLIIAPQYSATVILRVKPPYQERIPDIVCSPAITSDNIVVFIAKIPSEVTRWAGRVGYQLLLMDADGEAEATYSGTFNVQDGVPVENPDNVEDLAAYTLEDLYALLTNTTLLHSRITQMNDLLGLGEELETGYDSVIASLNEIAKIVDSGGGGTALPAYQGPYTVIPTAYAKQVLATQNTSVMHNITVEAVPIEKVSNTRGGLTATIA